MKLFGKGKTRKIVPNQDFLIGTMRYEKGKTYKVELNEARRYARNGWLEGSTADEPYAALGLDIDNGKLGQSGGF